MTREELVHDFRRSIDKVTLSTSEIRQFLMRERDVFYLIADKPWESAYSDAHMEYVCRIHFLAPDPESHRLIGKFLRHQHKQNRPERLLCKVRKSADDIECLSTLTAMERSAKKVGCRRSILNSASLFRCGR